MNTVTITTGWIGDGKSTATAYRPALAQDHPVAVWTDQTGADPTQGGTYTVEAQCDAATLAAIRADPKYSASVVVVQPAQAKGQ